MSLEESLAENQSLKTKVSELKSENSQLKHELSQLRKYLNGSASERYLPDEVAEGQIDLFTDEAQSKQEQIPALETKVIRTQARKKKKHPGRHPIPDHLPVRERIIEPDEDTSDMVLIGEEVTETVGFESGGPYKLITRRRKYAAKESDENGKTKIIVGQVPQRPLERSIAEASLLAYLFVSKFVDHLPFYRQIQQFKRNYNWEISSSTLNDWFVNTCTLTERLYDHMRQQVLSSDYIQADESPIKVLDSDKPKATHQGYQWVYRCGNTGIVLFNYRKGRGQYGPKEILNGYKGYLQTDGYKVYDKICRGKKEITQLGCWAHARRKFHEALDSDAERGAFALDVIQNIYLQQRKCRDMTSADRYAYRKEHIKPLFEQLKKWAESQQMEVLPKSPIAKALHYLLTQWPKLIAVLEDGRFELDNNLIENTIRPLALGRKNYLFAGSHAGAQRIAMMYSFFATCKAKGVNPYTWLTETLEKIGPTKLDQLHTLVPGYEKPDNQKSL